MVKYSEFVPARDDMITWITNGLTAILSGLMIGGTLWLWQVAGQDVFITRVMAIAQTCF
ncbi:MAG: hypothetical protein AAF423_06135 [Pseudomonadota bacterium]